MRYFVYLRPKIESTLKKLIYIFLLIAAMSSCAEKKQDTLAKVDDERYQWESIRKHIMENPELAFAMVDTAQTLGVADINYANWMRAQIHLVSHDPKDTEKGKEYCLMVLNNEDQATDSLGFVVDLICNQQSLDRECNAEHHRDQVKASEIHCCHGNYSADKGCLCHGVLNMRLRRYELDCSGISRIDLDRLCQRLTGSRSYGYRLV